MMNGGVRVGPVYSGASAGAARGAASEGVVMDGGLAAWGGAEGDRSVAGPARIAADRPTGATPHHDRERPRPPHRSAAVEGVLAMSGPGDQAGGLRYRCAGTDASSAFSSSSSASL